MSSLWTEHSTADGRKYWFHSTLLKSVWEKPEELKTPAEKLLELLPWKEFKTKEGKKYWYNSETKASTWSCPPELQSLIEQIKNEELQPPPPPTPSIVPVTTAASIISGAKSVHSAHSNEEVPDFQTKEDAEEAFIQLLRDSGVSSSWTWDRCMRSLVHYPMYKALKTVVERKEAFEKFILMLKREAREKEREAIENRRGAFMEMLKELNFGSYSRYSRCLKLCSSRPEWKNMQDDREREKVFDDYVYSLRRSEKEQERQMRLKNKEILRNIMESIDITEDSTWDEIYSKFTESELYVNDKEFQDEVDLNDLLTMFEEKMKLLESVSFETRRKERDFRIRRERLNRDNFKKLLNELKSSGKFDVNSKWKDIFILIKDDERFLNLLGQTGSTPMDLYRDFVVEMEEEVYQDGKVVQACLRDVNFIISPDSKLEDYLKILDERKCDVRQEHLSIIFEVLVDKALSKLREEKRRQEKRMKYLWDDFKYYIRKYNVEVKPDVPFEKISFALRKLDCEEDTKKQLYEKYLRRYKKDDADGDVSDVDMQDAQHLNEKSNYETRHYRSNHNDHTRPQEPTATYRKEEHRNEKENDKKSESKTAFVHNQDKQSLNKYDRPDRSSSRKRSYRRSGSRVSEYEDKRTKYRTRSPTPTEGGEIDYDG